MNMKMPDFNVKKLVRDAASSAGSTLSRVVQLTEEKLGTSEKTELDAHFENLSERAECTKVWTEKILRNTESVLTPNPGNRAEDFIFEKIEKKKPTRLSNIEYMGLDMIEAGGEFGQDGAYGSALLKVGQAEQKIGQCEREFISSADLCFVQPLRKFLEGEMKTITREKGILESKRLDLDACKNRVRKARGMLGQQSAERDLRVAQSEFDRQAEITKLLLEGIGSSQSSHLRHLHSLVEAQSNYYAQCLNAINDLQRDLVSMRPSTPRLRINSEDLIETNVGPPCLEVSLPSNHSQKSKLGAKQHTQHSTPFGDLETFVASNTSDILGGPQPYVPVGLDDDGNTSNAAAAGGSSRTAPNQRRARVLCSYDAKDATELNLTGNEVIFVAECSPPNTDYMYGKQGLHKGLVPRAFLEILDDEE